MLAARQTTRRTRAAPRALLQGLLLALAVSAASPAAHAVQPDEILADKALEARARNLSAGLRCLVCQNQSIDDSDAPLARDLRLLVRERLEAGDSDEAVKAFIVSRYGEFVLLKPPLSLHTLLLWLAPVLLMAGGIVLARRAMTATRDPAPAAAPLSAEEKAKLDAVLRDY